MNKAIIRQESINIKDLPKDMTLIDLEELAGQLDDVDAFFNRFWKERRLLKGGEQVWIRIIY